VGIQNAGFVSTQQNFEIVILTHFFKSILTSLQQEKVPLLILLQQVKLKMPFVSILKI